MKASLQQRRRKRPFDHVRYIRSSATVRAKDRDGTRHGAPSLWQVIRILLKSAVSYFFDSRFYNAIGPVQCPPEYLQPLHADGEPDEIRREPAVPLLLLRELGVGRPGGWIARLLASPTLARWEKRPRPLMNFSPASPPLMPNTTMPPNPFSRYRGPARGRITLQAGIADPATMGVPGGARPPAWHCRSAAASSAAGSRFPGETSRRCPDGCRRPGFAAGSAACAG